MRRRVFMATDEIKVGDVVHVRATVRNAGPAELFGQTGTGNHFLFALSDIVHVEPKRGGDEDRVTDGDM